MKISEEILQELRKLQGAEDGALSPEVVYRAAQMQEEFPKMHEWFDAHNAWDPDTAVQQFGLMLARRLIVRAKVVMPDGDREPVRVRAFVSIPERRGSKEGSYMRIEHVSKDEVLRRQALLGMVDDCERLVERAKRFASVVGDESLAEPIAAIEKWIEEQRAA